MFENETGMVHMFAVGTDSQPRLIYQLPGGGKCVVDRMLNTGLELPGYESRHCDNSLAQRVAAFLKSLFHTGGHDRNHHQKGAYRRVYA